MKLRRTQAWAISLAILVTAASVYANANDQFIGTKPKNLIQLPAWILAKISPPDARLAWPTSGKPCKGIRVRNVKELKSAIQSSQAGDVIALTDHIFELKESLVPKAGTTLCGQGARKTIVKNSSAWQPSTLQLPKKEDPTAYLIVIKHNNITIRDMSLHGPSAHGAIYGNRATNLTLAGLEIKDFLWSSVRTFGMQAMNVHDNDFIDAGGKFKATTGGALYDHYPQGCKVWNNRVRSSTNSSRPFYGFKGRGGRSCKFYNNDIRRNFAIEYPFDDNIGFEINHNYIEGTISIPKHAGGSVLENNKLSFHIHHNIIRPSYAIEFARNNVKIDHNLFDLNPKQDGGNLISNHGNVAAPGMLWMHDNLIRNVGRGVFWSKGVYNHIDFRNNHVRALTSPRTSAFFQLNGNTDFQTIKIDSNIFEGSPQNSRPLLRNGIGASATIQNNQFLNISDTAVYKNPKTGQVIGPKDTLQFAVGVHKKIQVNQWEISGVNP